MAVDAREPYRNYPIADEANKTREEFPRLREAVRAIGQDVASTLEQVAGKAAVDHTHLIAQIDGLQAILDSKISALPPIKFDDLSDVDVAGAADRQVPMMIAGKWIPGVISYTNLTNVPNQFPAAPHTHNAADINAGTIDPARLPAFYSGVQVVSEGNIAALTVAKQAQIVGGAVVTTTDGRRWIYTGSGSKTSEASYIELGDVTPEWAIIANKPEVIVNIQAYLNAKASLFADVNFRDIVASRGNGTGVVYFAGAYLFFDGGNWKFSAGGSIYHNGSRVHTDANYKPVIDVRLAGWWGHNGWDNGADNWSPDLWGGVVTRLHFRQTGQVMAAMECGGRYVQKNVNGTWYTVGLA